MKALVIRPSTFLFIAILLTLVLAATVLAQPGNVPPGNNPPAGPNPPAGGPGGSPLGSGGTITTTGTSLQPKGSPTGLARGGVANSTANNTVDADKAADDASNPAHAPSTTVTCRESVVAQGGFGPDIFSILNGEVEFFSGGFSYHYFDQNNFGTGHFGPGGDFYMGLDIYASERWCEQSGGRLVPGGGLHLGTGPLNIDAGIDIEEKWSATGGLSFPW